jgi:hypothetical protein
MAATDATREWCADRRHPWSTYNPWLDRSYCRCGQRQVTGVRPIDLDAAAEMFTCRCDAASECRCYTSTAPKEEPMPEPAAAPAAPAVDPTDRNTAIKLIRASLKERSDRTWSVTGGTGTSWGWIYISAPPARRDKYGSMTAEDAAELAQLLGLGDAAAHHQGVNVPRSGAYRREYVERAAGSLAPSVTGTPYWD